MKLKTCAVVCISVLVLASQVAAFDGQRKGFILGGGIGGSYLSYHEPYDFSLNKAAFATNFKIGYAPSNTFEVFYANNTQFFGFESNTWVVGASCIAVTKYMKPEGKGFFLTGGFGWAVFASVNRDAGSESGFGAFFGVGYDIAKHWNIQGDILYTSLADSWYTVGFRVTLNVLAF